MTRQWDVAISEIYAIFVSVSLTNTTKSQIGSKEVKKEGVDSVVTCNAKYGPSTVDHGAMRFF
jgi:hypothetical protein